MTAVRLLVLAVAVPVLLVGCASDDRSAGGGAPVEATGGDQDDQSTQRYPDVVDATAEKTGGTYTFTVTISSPYDTPERYADGWRVKGPDGTVYGEHTLLHDHANEQPFTRTQTGVRIPSGVREVIVEGHDKQHGYGGATKTVPLP